jgi:hypothetical protein
MTTFVKTTLEPTGWDFDQTYSDEIYGAVINAAGMNLFLKESP